MDIKKKNIINNITAEALYSVAYLCAQGVLMQTFLASLGFSSDFIYINTTIVQSAMILFSPVFSKWLDKGNIIIRAAVINLPIAAFFLFYLPVCISQDGSLLTFIYLTAISFLQGIAISQHIVSAYKLQYFIIPAENYGTVISVSGIISSCVSLGSGVVISALAAVMPFTTLMFYACIVSCALTLGCTFLTFRLKPLTHMEQTLAASKSEKNQTVPLKELFRTPIFLRMIPATMLRGLGNAAAAVVAAVALDLGFDTTVIAALVPIQSAATLFSYLVLGSLSKKVPARYLILASALSMLIFPLALLRNHYLFYIIIFIVVAGKNLLDVTIPLLLRKVVPMEISIPYNAWRLILFNVGTVASTAIAALIPVELLIFLAVGAQVFVGFSYFSDKAILENLRTSNIQ